jgi:hypothetical protein
MDHGPWNMAVCIKIFYGDPGTYRQRPVAEETNPEKPVSNAMWGDSEKSEPPSVRMMKKAEENVVARAPLTSCGAGSGSGVYPGAFPGQSPSSEK